MTARRRAGLYIDEALLNGLEQLKARDGIPISESTRRALADYLQKRGIRVRVSAATKRQKGQR
jgi:hypothetical protein